MQSGHNKWVLDKIPTNLLHVDTLYYTYVYLFQPNRLQLLNYNKYHYNNN